LVLFSKISNFDNFTTTGNDGRNFIFLEVLEDFFFYFSAAEEFQVIEMNWTFQIRRISQIYILFIDRLNFLYLARQLFFLRYYL